jgi:hypothetical protein
MTLSMMLKLYANMQKFKPSPNWVSFSVAFALGKSMQASITCNYSATLPQVAINAALSTQTGLESGLASFREAQTCGRVNSYYYLIPKVLFPVSDLALNNTIAFRPADGVLNTNSDFGNQVGDFLALTQSDS